MKGNYVLKAKGHSWVLSLCPECFGWPNIKLIQDRLTGEKNKLNFLLREAYEYETFGMIKAITLYTFKKTIN